MTRTTLSRIPKGTLAIETRNVRKSFGKNVAVHGLDLSVARGEVFGLLGPNGCGKTTTIRMLCGLLRPTSGTAKVVGYDIATQAEDLRNRIGYMSQKFGLYGDMTTAENLHFYAELYGVRGPVGARKRAEVIERLGLGERIDQMVGTMSGGWKQRVALACATAHDPELLFLDEPTAGVDPAARRQFWETIYGLAERGTTIVVTTHYMDEAARCQRVAFLSRGKLIAVGTPNEVTEHFGLASIEDVFIELQRRDEGANVAVKAREAVA
jgi:ABC-2 type transport system ATP-binding protein